MSITDIASTARHSFSIQYGSSTMICPSVVLYGAHIPQNVGSALRAAACFGIKQVWVIDGRLKLNPRHIKYHHPAKFRNRTVEPTELILDTEDVLYNVGPKIAVEIVDRAIPLSVFQHPTDAIYIFGPEDGSIPKRILEECKETVQITSNFCLNLAAAVNVVLYDRSTKVVSEH